MSLLIKLAVFISLVAIIGASAVFFNIVELGGGDSDSNEESANSDNQADEQELRQSAPIIASYKVVFDALWSADNGHTVIPEGAHFSPFVAWTHKQDVAMFEIGEKASNGVEVLAETGDTNLFVAELERQKQAGNVGEYVVGSLLNSPGTLERDLTVSKKYKFVSVVSMLAPSPDWFVAVKDIELFAENQWEQERKNLPTLVYDSGTDGGETFTAQDVDTADTVELLDPEVIDVKQGGGEIVRISVIRNQEDEN